MKSREEQQAMVEAKDQAEKLYRVIGNLPKSEASIDLLVQASELLKNVKDFTLPEPERWWYCNAHKELHQYESGTCKHCVEVPANDLDYVKSVIERKDLDLTEWEYRFPKKGEKYITNCDSKGTIVTAWSDHCVEYGDEMLFVRKAKPEAVAVQKEFDVYVSSDKKLRVKDWIIGNTPTLSEAWHYAIDRGMVMEFMFEGSFL